jgi:hypothetical protein
MSAAVVAGMTVPPQRDKSARQTGTDGGGIVEEDGVSRGADHDERPTVTPMNQATWR